jgi:hypothetical protein
MTVIFNHILENIFFSKNKYNKILFFSLFISNKELE